MEPTLSEKIRALRLERRWTQEELATYAGVTRRTVSGVENNADLGKLNLSTLLKVLRALDQELTLRKIGPPTLDELLEAQKLQVLPKLAGFRVRKPKGQA